MGDTHSTALVIGNLGDVLNTEDDHAGARALFEESLGLLRTLGDKWNIGRALCNIGNMDVLRGDAASATVLLEEALSIRRELEDKVGGAWALCHLGELACSMGDRTEARPLIVESLMLFRGLEDAKGLVSSLSAFATLLAPSLPEKAACLWGASQSLRNSMGLPRSPELQMEYESQSFESRLALGDDAFTLAWEHGAALTGEQTAAYALEASYATSQDSISVEP